ncbi:hypothetical protein H4582DRAFT_1816354, partial [Lactarius indigo]
SSNRVDVAFFSDGHCASKRNKFISDATRFVKEIPANQTFQARRCVLLGVGVGEVPKKQVATISITAICPACHFGLYRDGTELRGLYYAKPEVACDPCDSLGNRCDYGVLVGNDPLYGVVPWSSGRYTLVSVELPNHWGHELRHSIIGIGEEYDDGFAYFGPNSAHDVQRLPWAYWLSAVPKGSFSPHMRHIERSIIPLQVYPWTILNTTAPWRYVFHLSGMNTCHFVDFLLSASGAETVEGPMEPRFEERVKNLVHLLWLI